MATAKSDSAAPENRRKTGVPNSEATRFKPGNNANPGGRPKEVLGPAIRKYAQEHPEKVDALNQIIWTGALNGDINYVKFVSDRLDGPLVQKSETGPPGSFDKADGVPEDAAQRVIDAAKQFKRAS